MQLLKKNKIFIIFGIGIIVFSFLNIKEETIVLSKETTFKTKNFDIILSGGQSFSSKIIRKFNLNKDTYSHTGILFKKNNKVYVLHATTDGTKNNAIRFDEINDFIKLSTVNHYVILRNKLTNTQKSNLTKLFNKYKKIKKPFDYAFDNKNKDKLYCSELVFDFFNENKLIHSTINLNKPIHPKDFLTFQNFSIVEKR